MTRDEAMIYTLTKENDELKTEIGRLRQALEQEPVLDKMRNEIIQSIQNGVIKIASGNEALFHIIDKYKAESEC